MLSISRWYYCYLRRRKISSSISRDGCTKTVLTILHNPGFIYALLLMYTVYIKLWIVDSANTLNFFLSQMEHRTKIMTSVMLENNERWEQLNEIIWTWFLFLLCPYQGTEELYRSHPRDQAQYIQGTPFCSAILVVSRITVRPPGL